MLGPYSAYRLSSGKEQGPWAKCVPLIARPSLPEPV